ncbi:MAG TPA: hypothetical protein VGS23_09745, partial [Thermoplasmata archaeon]|nr:hypothetical protein [Thermoplasmata archaeon]
MSAPRTPSETAFRVADRLRRRPGPWDVYAEVIRRFEVHLNGREFEMRRGPILLEGYGFREIQPADGGVRIGFAGSTDLSERGIERTADEASTAGRFASFPAKEVTLPASTGSSTSVETVDPELWDHPETSIDRFLSEILAPLEGRTDVRPSFGSLRVSLVEVTFTNSSGAEGRRRRTVAELEFAIRSTDGGEGRPPGEYWVNQQSVSLDHRTAAGKVLDWCRKAKDARNAKPTPSGASQVLLPIEVLSDFVPATLGFRLGGQA